MPQAAPLARETEGPAAPEGATPRPEPTSANTPGFDFRAVSDAVERFGTPLYLYDENVVLDNIGRITRSVTYPSTRFYFAMVTNRAWPILCAVAASGWRFHFNAPLEVEVLAHALERGGVPAADAERTLSGSVFSGGSVSREQMTALMSRGIFMHLTAVDQLAAYGALAADVPGALRDVGLRVQFDENMLRARQGVSVSEVPRALDVARAAGLSITSVHMYRGTGTSSAERFAEPLPIFAALAERFPDLRHVDIGGGFGYDYESRGGCFDWHALDHFVQALMRRLNAHFGRQMELRLEIGRAAVASGGVFATRVLSRKPGFSGAEVILGMDASSMSVRAAAPAVVGKRHHFSVQRRRSGPEREELYTLVGPTTYTSDYLAKRVRIGGAGAEGVQVGDTIVVLDCGAYGAVTHSEFLTTPRPAEAVLTRDGNLRAVTKRAGVEQITSHWA